MNVYDPNSNMCHYKIHKDISELSDHIGIVDTTIYVIADETEEAEGDV